MYSGLQYLRARYYEPETGRFMTNDSYLGNVMNPLTLNRYDYTSNNPVMNYDPSGHWPKFLDNLKSQVSSTLGSLYNNAMSILSGAINTFENGANIVTSYLSNKYDEFMTRGEGLLNRAVRYTQSVYKSIVPSKHKASSDIHETIKAKIEAVHKATCKGLSHLKENGERLASGIAKIGNGGIVTAIGAVVVVGGVTILTGGADLPLLAVVGTTGVTAAGATSVVMGTSDISEGTQDIYHAAKNDNKQSINLVRDKIFNGNAEAYNITEMVTTTIAGYGGASVLPYAGAASNITKKAIVNNSEEKLPEGVRAQSNHYIDPGSNAIGTYEGAGNAAYSSIEDGLNFSTKAAEHMDETGRSVPVQTLRDTIESTEGVPDPRGSDAMMHYTTMVKNGKTYNLEVLYDEKTNTVYHFEYTRDAIGNLPAIKK